MPAGDRWVDHRGGRKEPSASAVTAGRSLAGGGGSRFRGLLSPGALSSRPAGPPTSGRLDVSEHTDGSVAMGPRLGLWGEVVTGDSGKAGGGRGGLGRGVASASVPLQPCQTPPPTCSRAALCWGEGGRIAPCLAPAATGGGGGSPVPQQRPQRPDDTPDHSDQAGRRPGLKPGLRRTEPPAGPRGQRRTSLPRVCPGRCSYDSCCALFPFNWVNMCLQLPPYGGDRAAAAAAPEMTNNSSMGRPLPSAQQCSSCTRRRNQIRKINRAGRIFP